VELALQRIPFMDGRTNMADALTYMTNTIFTTANGMRSDARQFAFVLTDGNANINVPATIPAAVTARNQGITIIAWGVGTDVNQFILNNIASEPYASNVLSVTSQSQLPTLLKPLIAAVCEDTNACSSNPCQNGGSCVRLPHSYMCNCAQQYSGMNCERRCPLQADVALVLDLSGSIEEVYNMTVAFAKAFVLGIPVGTGQTKAAVVYFSDTPTILFDFNMYTTSAQIRQALSFAPALGTTNTQAAITLTTQTVFTSVHGDRAGVKNIMCIVTDGNSNVQQSNTIPAAKAAQQAGIEVYTVGVGPEVNPPEIDGMASAPVQAHEQYLVSPSDVVNTASKMLDQICQQ